MAFSQSRGFRPGDYNDVTFALQSAIQLWRNTFDLAHGWLMLVSRMPLQANKFKGYRAQASSAFVVESDSQPKPGVEYLYYRCRKVFTRLTCWLRQNGIKGNKPLHIFRKEFGSRVNELYGIHAARPALRHSSVTVTDLYYTDGRRRAVPGFGALLAPPNASSP